MFFSEVSFQSDTFHLFDCTLTMWTKNTTLNFHPDKKEWKTLGASIRFSQAVYPFSYSDVNSNSCLRLRDESVLGSTCLFRSSRVSIPVIISGQDRDLRSPEWDNEKILSTVYGRGSFRNLSEGKRRVILGETCWRKTRRDGVLNHEESNYDYNVSGLLWQRFLWGKEQDGDGVTRPTILGILKDIYDVEV